MTKDVSAWTGEGNGHMSRRKESGLEQAGRTLDGLRRRGFIHWYAEPITGTITPEQEPPGQVTDGALQRWSDEQSALMDAHDAEHEAWMEAGHPLPWPPAPEGDPR